jgi:hypothetical protein
MYSCSMFSNIIWIITIQVYVLRGFSVTLLHFYFHLSFPFCYLFRSKSIVKHRNNKSVSELLCSTHRQSEVVTHKFGSNMAQLL